jgi:23S rRNA pseudouridine955/2504/2580 synthase
VYEIVQNNIENGKLAITHYKLLKNLNNGLSLVEFTPLTGRMHQLRLHAKMLDCPIIGDVKYGNHQSIALSKKMLLHAKKLVLPKEIFGKEIIINSELPEYFVKYIT